jgi:hypothetical protein
VATNEHRLLRVVKSINGDVESASGLGARWSPPSASRPVSRVVSEASIRHSHSIRRNTSRYRLALKQRAGVGRSFDHLVVHAVVKRAYVELHERAPYLKRLAFYTMTEEDVAQFEWVHLAGSRPEDIDVVVPLNEVDLEAMRRAFGCYVTYAETIETSGIKRNIPREAVFEIHQEAHDPPLDDLFGGLT